MGILENGNLMSPELQVELADYGIMRATAKEEAKKYSGPGPAYFGISEESDSFKLHFTNDLDSIDEDKMHLAIVAPDHETFDMLAPKDYGKKLSLKDPTTLRTFLRKLVDLV